MQLYASVGAGSTQATLQGVPWIDQGKDTHVQATTEARNTDSVPAAGALWDLIMANGQPPVPCLQQCQHRRLKYRF